MREEFLSYIWEYKLLCSKSLTTTAGKELEIISPGIKNNNSGPDFLAAKVRIGNTIWAGNVEIHLKTSDWRHHGHHNDPAYSNIILHVVFEDDTSVNKNKCLYPQPCLEIKEQINKEYFKNFQALINNKAWIPCRSNINETGGVVLSSWLSRLLVERLESKSGEILHFLKYFNGNWDETFYYFLAKNFGFKKNKTAFGILAQKTPYSLLWKHKDKLLQIEALLFGQAGLLDESLKEVYAKTLFNEYSFYKTKYALQSLDKKLWKYAKLRPANFPGLRISQFAMLIFKSGKLFSELVLNENIESIKESLRVECSPFWLDHYRFDKKSVRKSKAIGEESINNILINTILPFMFVYGKERMNTALTERPIEFLSKLPAEQNHIINKWKSLGVKPSNAADSQSLIELKKNYCTAKKCLKCPIGHKIISS